MLCLGPNDGKPAAFAPFARPRGTSRSRKRASRSQSYFLFVTPTDRRPGADHCPLSHAPARFPWRAMARGRLGGKPIDRIHHLIWLIVFTCTLSVTSRCDAETDFDELPRQQQELLERFRPRWDSLTEEQRARALEGARRYRSMDSEQRDLFQRRARRWQSMDPEQRQRIKRRYKQFKSLPEAERRSLRERYESSRQRAPSDRTRPRER